MSSKTRGKKTAKHFPSLFLQNDLTCSQCFYPKKVTWWEENIQKKHCNFYTGKKINEKKVNKYIFLFKIYFTTSDLWKNIKKVVSKYFISVDCFRFHLKIQYIFTILRILYISFHTCQITFYTMCSVKSFHWSSNYYHMLFLQKHMTSNDSYTLGSLYLLAMQTQANLKFSVKIILNYDHWNHKKWEKSFYAYIYSSIKKYYKCFIALVFGYPQK